MLAPRRGPGRAGEGPGTRGHRPATGDFSLLAEDAGGNLWLNTHPPAVALRRGAGWAPAPRSLVEVPGRSIETIFAEPDGVVWLATDKGLYPLRGDGSGRRPGPAAAAPVAPHDVERRAPLRRRARRRRRRTADLPPYLRHLRIEFAPLSFRAGLRYQTRLEPLDAGWSAPTAEPFAELTRLPPGDYTFHVRTLGPNGEVGPETAWSFHVRSPWYQTRVGAGALDRRWRCSRSGATPGCAAAPCTSGRRGWRRG